MPKLKTRRSAAARFKLTGSGKIRRAKAYHNHKLTGKSSKRKRQLRQGTSVDSSDAPRIRREIPYL